jgi:hypothetical protein
LVAVSTSPKARLRDGSYCWMMSSLSPGRSKRLTIVVSALSRVSGRRINRATANASNALPATASRAVTVHRIHVLGGGVTG